MSLDTFVITEVWINKTETVSDVFISNKHLHLAKKYVNWRSGKTNDNFISGQVALRFFLPRYLREKQVRLDQKVRVDPKVLVGKMAFQAPRESQDVRDWQAETGQMERRVQL